MKYKKGFLVIKPDSDSNDYIGSRVFLAGSIEMGNSIDWQSNVIDEMENSNITIYNPRRDKWNSEWEQLERSPEFNFQVNWELNRLDQSDVILMNFLPDTKSPISLLELGLYATSGKIIVVCPDGFWRKGNVQIICTRNNIPLFNNLEDGIGALRTKLSMFNN